MLCDILKTLSDKVDNKVLTNNFNLEHHINWFYEKKQKYFDENFAFHDRKAEIPFSAWPGITF